jgi:predicted dehydrogenase
MLTVIGGGEPVVPLADFADAYEIQRVLSAVVESDKQRSPVPLDQIQ